MQTVQFQCGGCGKLMAVNVDHVGRQVRCPHCQTVVVAPAAAPDMSIPPPPTSPVETAAAGSNPFAVVQANQDAESIFGPPEVSDDLFDAPAAPRLDFAPAIPPPPVVPAEPPSALPERLLGTPGGEVEAVSRAHSFEGQTSEHGPDPVGLSGSVAGTIDAFSPQEKSLSPGAGFVPADGAAESQPAGFGGTGLEVQAPAAIAGRPSRRATPYRGSGWFLLLFLFPLISYAILATIAVIILWNRLQLRPPDPREYLPDVDGDTPGALKPKAMRYDNRLSDEPLPEYLRVRLGQQIALGDLQVTPTRVERKKVAVFVEGRARPEPLEYASLVLHLRLRNLAQDYAFAPLDNYFDRYDTGGWQRPLTLLEAGREHFHGGPARWYPRGEAKRDKPLREWVEGRKEFDDAGLQPGEEVDGFVCTDGKEHIADYLAAYRGPLRWRVHLRRGLVDWQGVRKPATAIIGVEFTDRQITPAETPVSARNG